MSNRIFGEHAGQLRDTQLQILLLAGITAPLAVSLISPIFDALIDPFGASPSTIGLLVSAYTAPAIVMIPLSGALSDRYGRKPILITGLLLFGTAGAAISMVSEFWTVLLLRVVQGIGSAGISPVVITSIGDLYSDAEAATGQGLRIGAVGAAQAVFPPLAAALAILSWRVPFLLYGMSIPIAVIVYLRFEEPSPGDTGNPGGTRSYPRRLFRLAIRPHVFLTLLAYTGPIFLYFGFQAYVSIHVVRVLEGTPRGAGMIVALFSVVYAVAATQAGRIAERFTDRYRPLIGANVIMGAGLAGFAFAPTVSVASLTGAVFAVGYGLTSSFYRSILPEFAPASLRGGLVSAAETLGRLGATVSPIAMGVFIGVATPVVGFEDAIRWTIFSLGVLAGIFGVVAVSIASIIERRE